MGSGTTGTFTNGVLATHSVNISNTGNFTITATDSVGGVGTGSESGVSNSFTVELTLDHFLVEAFGGGAIGTQTAATGFNIQITAQDSGNNTVIGFDGTVEITSTGTLSLGGGTTASFTNGVLASHSMTITNTGSFTITATDSVGGMGSGTETGVSNAFTVDSGPLDHFVVEAAGGGAIGTQTAGTALNIQITAQDANNNTMTFFDGAGNTVDVTSTGTISVGSGATATFTNGVLASHSVTISNTGNFTFTVTDSAGGLGTGTENGVSNSFTVNPGALDHFLVEAVGGGVIADQAVGIAFSIQITAQDANNNTVTAFDGAGNTTDISSTGTLSAGGGTTATFTNGLLSSLSVTMGNTGSFTITATDSAGGLGTGAELGVTNAFTVDPGPPAQLVFVTQPGSGTGGLALGTQPMVEVQDAQGNTVTTDPGAPNETVTMTFTVGTNGEGATLTGTTTVAINWTTGQASFTDLTVDLVGSYQLTASTNLGVFTTDSSAFTVTEGPPVGVAFSAQPTNTVSTVSIAPAIRVQVLDAGGNQVTAATNSITLGMSNNPGAGTLSGTLTVAAVNGEATFSNISIDKAGTGYTINASSTGLNPATSVGFDITGSIATQLLFTIPPSSGESGAAIVPTMQLEVMDAGGNLVTTATNLITLAIGNNPSGGTLSGTFTNVAAVGGRATFSDISIDLAGTGYTLVASTTGLTSATSAPFNITVSVSSQIAGIQTSVGVIQSELAIASQDTAVIAPTTTSIQQDTTAIKQNTTTIVQDTAIILQDTTEIREDTVEIKAATDSISTFGEQIETLPEQLASIEADVAAKILTRPTTVKKGESISIQFQSETGLSPTMTLYDPENLQVETDLPMTEIGDTGIYKTDVPVKSEWLNGDYTAMVSESVKGSLESMVLTVGDTDIQSLSGDIAGVQGQVSQASSAASAARDIVEEVRKELGGEGQSQTAYEMITNLETALDTIKDRIGEIPQSLEVEPMHNSIREINELLKQIGSENGVNLDVMYGSIDETTKDVDELQNQVERLKVLMNLNRELAEKILDRSPPEEPVVKTWFEAGS